MRVIYYKETEQRIQARIAAYNAACPVVTRNVTRKHRDKSVTYSYVTKTGALNGNHERTAMALLKVLQSVQHQSSAAALDTFAQIIDVTMPAIATMTGYHAGTIHRHVKRLLAAGVLTNKTNRKARTVAPGVYRYQPVQLIFDRSVIAYKDKLTQREAQEAWENAVLENAEAQAVELGVRTECSHMHSEKLQKALVNRCTTQPSEPTAPLCDMVGQRSKKTEVQKPAATDGNSQKISEGAAALHFLRLRLVAVLWTFIRARLYTHWTYMSPMESRAASAFFADLFANADTERTIWIEFNNAVEVIEGRARWAELDEEKVRRMKRPGVYFNSANPDGYLQAVKWWAKNKSEKKGVTSAVDSLERAQTLIERKLFNSYLKNPTLKRRLLVEQRLAQLKDAEHARQRFNALDAFKPLEPVT